MCHSMVFYVSPKRSVQPCSQGNSGSWNVLGVARASCSQDMRCMKSAPLLHRTSPDFKYVLGILEL